MAILFSVTMFTVGSEEQSENLFSLCPSEPTEALSCAMTVLIFHRRFVRFLRPARARIIAPGFRTIGNNRGGFFEDSPPIRRASSFTSSNLERSWTNESFSVPCPIPSMRETSCSSNEICMALKSESPSFLYSTKGSRWPYARKFTELRI